MISAECLPGVYLSGQAMAYLQEERALLMSHLVASTDDLRKGVEKRLHERSAALQKMVDEYANTIETDEERALVATLNETNAAWKRAIESVLVWSRQAQAEAAISTYDANGYAAYSEMKKAAIAISDFNKAKSDAEAAKITSLAQTAKLGMMIGLGGAVLASIGLGFIIIRGTNRALTRISGTLGENSRQVANAAAQVSGSSQSLAGAASEQAASLEETTSALQEMSSMTGRNAESAAQAASLAAEAKSSADKGNAAMMRMSEAIGSIQRSAQDTAKIIKVIDEIAFQTNLLALNAAVEAARAGEAGKGFAVVAEEVRNLAMRSAEAAKNTASLIEESVQASRNGVTISTDVGQTLGEITTAVASVNDLITEIAQSSSEQSRGIQQVNQAVAQMDHATQSSAANAEESAAAAEELSGQAIALDNVIAELRAMVTGERAAVGSAVRPSASATGAAKREFTLPPPSTTAHKDDFAEFRNAA